jgi:5-methylcytosine-specific restriction endonuclease McrA
VSGRGSRWHAARTQAIRTAPFCALCGNFKRLDVHHIIPFRITHDNNQENLIPLCKKHHKVIETIYHDLEAENLELSTLQLWFRNTLSGWQAASRFILRRLERSRDQQFSRARILAHRTAD